jgi:hypothetical protein
MSMRRKYKRQFARQEDKYIQIGKDKSTEIKHPVHGYFIYRCENCGAVYKMYLDKGLEDRVQDKYYPEKHKPVPFAISCRACTGGWCNHILWGVGDSDEYTELPEGANYFKNSRKEECGKPIITIPDARNLGEFYAKEASDVFYRRKDI